MRTHTGRILRGIAMLLTATADRLDPQPTARHPGSFTTTHSGTGTTTTTAWPTQPPNGFGIPERKP